MSDGRPAESMTVRLVRKFKSCLESRISLIGFQDKLSTEGRSVCQQCSCVSEMFYFCNHKGPWLIQVSFGTQLSILKFLRGTNPDWDSLGHRGRLSSPPSLWPAPLRRPQAHSKDTHFGSRHVTEHRAPGTLYRLRNEVSHRLHRMLVSKDCHSRLYTT